MKSSQSKTYKALMLDVDGTLFPANEGREGTPSKKVIEAINKASKKIHIGIATSRPLFYLTHILKRIDLLGPSIINGGSQIIDFPSKKIIWEKPLEKQDAMKICKELKKFIDKRFYLNNGSEDVTYDGKYVPKKLLQIYIAGFTMADADRAVTRLTTISSKSAVYKVPSWRENKTDIIVTHAQATKQHAILEVAKILGITTHEIIGVGDGYNDFPLLMACGLKVAMGNAVEDLKAIADYIAPPVEKDGVVDVIEKFVL